MYRSTLAATRERLIKDHLVKPGLCLPSGKPPARRDADAAKVRAVIKKLDAQQNAQIAALEDIPGDPAAAAVRARIVGRGCWSAA
jgi:hypothetical protein